MSWQNARGARGRRLPRPPYLLEHTA
jgi:hypothetical protein